MRVMRENSTSIKKLQESVRAHGGIYFITTKNMRLGHVESAQAALEGGVRIIQYREKSASMHTMVEEARRIKDLCKKHDAIFIVDDKVEVAIACEADGVHVGEEDMPLEAVKKLFPGKIIGVSANNVQQAIDAQNGGATYIGVGAIFPTSTKAKAQAIGLDMLDEIRKAVSLPIYPIGGLKLKHVEEIARLGVDGMAVITAISDAENPQAAATELVAQWNRSLRH